MKQSLQLKLGQQLTMTPQLQQAIRLLQLSTLDLQQEIQQALESNPMLEASEDEPAAESPATAEETTPANAGDGPMESLEQAADWGDNSDVETSNNSEVLPDDLPVDTQWDDLLPSASAPPPLLPP